MQAVTSVRATHARSGGQTAWRAALGAALLLLLCIASAAIGRFCFLVHPFDSDGTMFIYMGRLVCDGGRFFHDLIDNKFPTVGFVTSIAWRLLGLNWTAYVTTGFAIGLIIPLLLGRIARRHLGDHAILPTVVFGIVYFNFSIPVFGGFQLETLQALFATLAAAAAIEALRGDRLSDAFVVGLCAGMAALLKPTGLSVAAAFAAASILLRRRDLKTLLPHLLAMAAGVAIPLAAATLYLWQADGLRQIPWLCRQIGRYASESELNWWDSTKLLTVAALLAIPWITRLWFSRHKQYRLATPLPNDLLLFGIIWLTIETIGVISQRRMYAYHFLVIVPAATLLYGLLPRRDRLITHLVAMLPVMILSTFGAWLIVHAGDRDRQTPQLTAYLAPRTQPTDRIWKDDMPDLLLSTGLQPGSRYPLTFLFVNYDHAGIELGNEIVSDFARSRPLYIILPTDVDAHVKFMSKAILELDRRPQRRASYAAGWKQIEQYTLDHYHPEAQIGSQTLYRLSD